LRTYWANQQTGLVDDVVFELQPAAELGEMCWNDGHATVRNAALRGAAKFQAPNHQTPKKGRNSKNQNARSGAVNTISRMGVQSAIWRGTDCGQWRQAPAAV